MRRERITDKDILSMDKVSVDTAAAYLGTSKPFIFMGLRCQRLPFGVAVKNKQWMYHISPGLLVAYKRGKLKIETVVHKPEEGE